MRYAVDMEKEGIERIGVDLDGTLVKWYGTSSAEYVPDKLGEPIVEMVNRVKVWLSKGYEVVIFTARAHPAHTVDADIAKMAIRKWCRETFGVELEITCMKDPMMTRIYDDRAITVEKDTGRILTIGYEDDGPEIPDSLGSLL
jgi:hypothetical protein